MPVFLTLGATRHRELARAALSLGGSRLVVVREPGVPPDPDALHRLQVEGAELTGSAPPDGEGALEWDVVTRPSLRANTRDPDLTLHLEACSLVVFETPFPLGTSIPAVAAEHPGIVVSPGLETKIQRVAETVWIMLSACSPGDPRLPVVAVSGPEDVRLHRIPWRARKVDCDPWWHSPAVSKSYRASDHGADLAIALLGPQIHAVFAPLSEPWPPDPRDLVHDVRVASRRLREGVSLLRPCLPNRAERLMGQLKDLGRRLGALRELDVSILGAEQIRDAEVREVICGEAATRRKAVEAWSDDGRIRHLGIECWDVAMHAGANPSFARMAGRQLRRRTRAAIKRLEALSDPRDIAGHHELRIAAKKLRYTCEFLRPAFPETDAIKDLKALQDVLGRKHDLEVLDALITSTRDVSPHLAEQTFSVQKDLERNIDELWAEARDLGRRSIQRALDHLESIAGGLS